jgi:hypothetical protein
MIYIYRKTFVFEAERFEEYKEGKCIHQGSIKCTIKAAERDYNPFDVISIALYNEISYKASGCDIDGGMSFSLSGEIPYGINKQFNLPIMDGDILPDRVQYGRLPYSWADSKEPVVCNIFNNMNCIRFAMMSPLRIIEFYGKFTEIK